MDFIKIDGAITPLLTVEYHGSLNFGGIVQTADIGDSKTFFAPLNSYEMGALLEESYMFDVALSNEGGIVPELPWNEHSINMLHTYQHSGSTWNWTATLTYASSNHTTHAGLGGGDEFYEVVNDFYYPREHQMYAVRIKETETFGGHEIVGIMGAITDWNAPYRKRAIGFWGSSSYHSDVEPIEVEEEEDSPDKTDQGGYNQGGYGGGRITVDIGFPNLPTIDLRATGSHLYRLSSGQMEQFSNYLWSDDFFHNVSKIFQDPIEAVVSCQIIDFSPNEIGSSNIIVGNTSSGVTATEISDWCSVNCGQLFVPEALGTYADYSPYSRCDIFLPHVGIVPFDIDVAMNNTIEIQYNINVTSGQAVCFILVYNSRNDSHYSVYKAIPCTCSARVPLSSRDSTERYSAMIGLCGSIGMTFASGGAGAGNMIGDAMNVLTAKDHVIGSGTLADMQTMLSSKTPYLIIYQNNLIHAGNQNHFDGYELFYNDYLSNVHGYTKMRSLRLNIEAPDDFINDIKTQLLNGVVLP